MEGIGEHGWGWGWGSEVGESETARVKATGRGGTGTAADGARSGIHVDEVLYVGEIGVDCEEGFVIGGERLRLVEAGTFPGSFLVPPHRKRGKVRGWITMQGGRVSVDGEL